MDLKWYFFYPLFLIAFSSIWNTLHSTYSYRIKRFLKFYKKLNDKARNSNITQEEIFETATKVYLKLKNKPEIASKIYNELFNYLDLKPENLKELLRLLLRAEDNYEFKVYKPISDMDFVIYPGVDDAIKKYETNNKL